MVSSPAPGTHQLDPDGTAVGAAFRLRPGADADDIADRIERVTGHERNVIFAGVRPTKIVNVARITFVPFVLTVVLAVLAVIAIGSAVFTAVRRRRHDVTVLRSMGADDRWLVHAGHWQAIAATLVPVAIGVPLGIVAGRLVFRLYADNLGTLNDATWPFAAFVLGAVPRSLSSPPSPRRSPVMTPAGPPRPSCCVPSDHYAGNASARARRRRSAPSGRRSRRSCHGSRRGRTTGRATALDQSLHPQLGVLAWALASAWLNRRMLVLAYGPPSRCVLTSTHTTGSVTSIAVVRVDGDRCSPVARTDGDVRRVVGAEGDDPAALEPVAADLAGDLLAGELSVEVLDDRAGTRDLEPHVLHAQPAVLGAEL